jgi:hypothetical protein
MCTPMHIVKKSVAGIILYATAAINTAIVNKLRMTLAILY